MLITENKLYAEYTYFCDKHIDCQYAMRITCCGSTKFWIVSDSGNHSEVLTSIPLARGINPIYIPFIDSQIERNVGPKTILKLIRGQAWTDKVPFPTALQITNRKQHSAGVKQGPLTQYKFAVNLIQWVNDNMLRSKDQYEKLPDDKYFTMGYVEYTKQTKKGPEAAIGFAYTTKGKILVHYLINYNKSNNKLKYYAVFVLIKLY